MTWPKRLTPAPVQPEAPERPAARNRDIAMVHGTMEAEADFLRRREELLSGPSPGPPKQWTTLHSLSRVPLGLGKTYTASHSILISVKDGKRVYEKHLERWLLNRCARSRSIQASNHFS
jgi:hypothetical protein